MSAVFDILLLVIVLIFVIVGGKKGLVRSVSGFLCYIFAFNFANYFYIFVMRLTDKIGFIANMKAAAVASHAEEFIDKSDGFLTHVSGIVNAVFSFKDTLFNPELVASAEETDPIVFQEKFNYLVADAVSALFAFLSLLIVSILVFKLLTMLVDSFFSNTPVLKQINSVLGAVFGVFCGLFWAWVATKVFVSFLFPFLNGKYPLVFPADMISSTVVTLCLKLNPLYFLMLFTKWCASLFH